MKTQCDKCGKPAAVHLTEISGGKKIEKHLCEQCAVDEGIAAKTNVPISQLLEEFILQGQEGGEATETVCDVCGMSFSDFRQHALLGCPNDYEAFEGQLLPLLQRAQENASQHIGKVPQRAGNDQKRQMTMLRLRAQLKAAIAAEQYEQAVILRDQIKQLESSSD